MLPVIAQIQRDKGELYSGSRRTLGSSIRVAVHANTKTCPICVAVYANSFFTGSSKPGRSFEVKLSLNASVRWGRLAVQISIS